jgi:membrane protease YdiL (CAAX protease family)
MGLAMSGRDVLDGLERSAFIADLDGRDRRPLPILGTLTAGPIAGAVAALAAMVLILALCTLVSGHGGEGLAGISNLLIAVRDQTTPTLFTTALQLMLDTSVNGAFVLAFVAVAAAFAGRAFIAYVTVAARVRWRLILVGLILSAAVLAPVMIVDRIVSGGGDLAPILSISPGWRGRAVYALTVLLFIPAAAAEELLFRGWLLRQTAAFVRRPLLLIAGTAVLFAALHLDFNPDSFLTRTLMGAGFAYMTLRLGGVEFSTGAHAANNILIVLFIEPLTLQAPHEASGITALSLIEDVALVLGYVAITEAVALSPVLRRWSGLRPDDVSPSTWISPRGLRGPGGRDLP